MDDIIAQGALAPPRKNAKTGPLDSLLPETHETSSKRKGKATPGIPIKRSKTKSPSPAPSPTILTNSDVESEKAAKAKAPKPKTRKSKKTKAKTMENQPIGGTVSHTAASPVPMRPVYKHQYATRSQTSLSSDLSEEDRGDNWLRYSDSEDMTDKPAHASISCSLKQQWRDRYLEEDRSGTPFEEYLEDCIEAEIINCLSKLEIQPDFRETSKIPPS